MLESYSNISTLDDAKKTFIKLIDFGYSLDFKEDLSEYQEIMDPFVIGTPDYLAPELLK